MQVRIVELICGCCGDSIVAYADNEDPLAPGYLADPCAGCAAAVDDDDEQCAGCAAAVDDDDEQP
jgi:hypothetical protein